MPAGAEAAGGRSKGGRAKQALIVTKWVGFVTAIWVQAIAGNNYTFANYSQALKKVMNLNQTQLNNLGVAKDVGKSFGVVSGIAMDLIPPWAILLIGSVEGLIGYGAQWLVVSKIISPLPYWQMCIFMCFGGNSTTWMNTACLVTCLRNFPSRRGTVVGIMKGLVSLSTAIFTLLCTALFTSDPSAFLLLLSVLPLIICTFAMVFLRPVPPSSDSAEDELEENNFTFLNIMSIIIAVYLFAFTIMVELFQVSPLVYKIYSVGLLLLLASPVAFPIKLLIASSSWWGKGQGKDCPSHAQDDDGGEGKKRLLSSEEQATAEAHDVVEPLLLTRNRHATADLNESDTVGHQATARTHPNQEELLIPAVPVTARTKPTLGDDFSIFGALATFDFWLLFVTFLCGIGTGITAINNLGQIGESLGYEDVAIFVSLISIWGFFGRLGAGALSEHYVKSSALPRPLWIVVSHAFMFLGYLSWAGGLPGSMYLSSVLVGACYGVHIAIAVPVASELFGLKNFGMLYNILIINIPLGSFVFSGLLAGWLYDREAKKQEAADGSGSWLTELFTWNSSTALLLSSEGDAVRSCIGPRCFRTVFVLMAGTCLLGLVSAAILTFRSRRAYVSLYGPEGSVVARRLK